MFSFDVAFCYLVATVAGSYNLKRILQPSAWTYTTVAIFLALITKTDTVAVPHKPAVEGQLLPEIAEEKKLNRFVHIGEASIKMGSAYVTTSLEFLSVLCALEKFVKYADDMYEAGDNAGGKRPIHGKNWWLRPYRERIHEAHRKMNSIVDSLQLSEPYSCIHAEGKSRRKRAIFTLLKLGGMALNIGQMYAVDRKVNGLSKKVDIIATRINATDTRLGKLTEEFKKWQVSTAEQFEGINTRYHFSLQVDKAEELVRNIRFVVNQLHNGKLDSTLIGEEKLKSQVQTIKTLAEAKNQKLPALAAQSLYTLPLSYYIRSDGILNLYIDIPLISSQLLMNLYRQIPIPFRLEGQDFQFDTMDEFILVGQSVNDVFTTLTRAQFNNCNNMDGLLICSDVPALLRHDVRLEGKDRQRCTYALFDTDARAVANFCTVSPPKHLEVVHYMGHNRFVMYTSHPAELEVNCPKLPATKFIVKHTATIYLPAGCTAKTEANYFYALSRVESDNTHLDKFVDSDDFLRRVENQTDLLGLDMKDKNQWLLETLHKDISTIQEVVEHEQDDYVLKNFSTPAGIAALVALSLITAAATTSGYVVFRYRRKIKALIRFINTSRDILRLKGRTRSFRQKLGGVIVGKPPKSPIGSDVDTEDTTLGDAETNV